MNQSITEDTLRLMRGVNGAMDMVKAWLSPTGNTTGLQNYDLEKPALSVVPVETPFFNRIPIVGANGGIQANWHAITGINTTRISAGLGFGQRNSPITTTTADYFAKFCAFGLDDFIQEEAEWSAEGYMDLLSRGQSNLTWAVKIAMEQIYVGGQGTYGLGQGNRPTLSDVGTGGTLAYNTTYSVIVAPLTLDGYFGSTVASGVPGLVSRTNADKSTVQYGGGTGQPSQNRTVTTANDSNNTHSIQATTALISGAAAYAWFWGMAGSEVLGAITTINSLLITAAATGTQTAASLVGDNSMNSLVCDGFMAQISKSGMNGYNVSQATGTAGTGTPLTADGDGGIVEFDTDFKYFFDNFRASPTAVWLSSQEFLNVGKKIAQGPSTGTSNIRFTYSTSGQLVGGTLARAYLNKFTVGLSGGPSGGQEVPINLHPTLPPGTMLYEMMKVPFPLSGINNVVQFRARKNFFATLWPKTTRQWDFGVYLDGVLQNYFIPGWGIRQNIGNG